MSGRRRAALIREFRRSYGFSPSPAELRQFKRAYVRKQTRRIHLDGTGGFYPMDRR